MMDIAALYALLVFSNMGLGLSVWRFLHTRIRDRDIRRLFGDLNGVGFDPDSEDSKERARLAYGLGYLPIGLRGVQANTWHPFDHRGTLSFITKDGTRTEINVYVSCNPFEEH